MRQVHVERSYSPSPNPGYTWTVTFTSNTGAQPPMVVNAANLLGPSPIVAQATVNPGSAPDNYVAQTVPPPPDGGANGMHVDFSMLTTGVTWYFRVVATNDIGDGPYGTPVTAVPAAAPGAPSALTLGYASATSLLATYPQDAAPHGAPVGNYLLRVTSATTDVNLTVPLTYKAQTVTTSAYRLPFTPSSTFSLALGTYKVCPYPTSSTTMRLLLTTTPSVPASVVPRACTRCTRRAAPSTPPTGCAWTAATRTCCTARPTRPPGRPTCARTSRRGSTSPCRDR